MILSLLLALKGGGFSFCKQEEVVVVVVVFYTQIHILFQLSSTRFVVKK